METPDTLTINFLLALRSNAYSYKLYGNELNLPKNEELEGNTKNQRIIKELAASLKCLRKKLDFNERRDSYVIRNPKTRNVSRKN